MNELRKELLEETNIANAAYLLDFLWHHALNWAKKQYSMSDEQAHEYAAWYVGTFGQIWVNEVSAPPHSGSTIFKFARFLTAEGD